jgi:hypothetical protein
LRSYIVHFWSGVFDKLRWVSCFEFIRLIFRKTIAKYACMEAFIDSWVLGNLILAGISLFFPIALTVKIALSLWGALRVVEIFIYQVNVLLFDEYRSALKGPVYALIGYRRIFILLLHNYVEIVLWFALLYNLHSDLFSYAEQLGHQNPLTTSVGALYYSIVTMTTLGYGDIMPSADNGRLIVIAQVTAGVFLTLTVIARYIAYLPKPNTYDPLENND